MAIKTIDVSEIVLGMELAEPVKNMYGQLLLSDGSSLAENHIKLFKTWGIQSVVITSDEEQAPLEVSTNLDFATIAVLKKRINWTPMNEHEADLYNLAVQIISKQTKS